jgi:DNA polymerase-3 subunit gamma/tau
MPVADTLGEKTSLPPVIPLSDQGKKTPPTIQAQEAPQVWRKMIEQLPLSGLARELALNCVLKSQDGNRCRLLLPPSAQHLWSEKLESRLEQILRIHYGNDLQITITVADLDGQVTPLEEAQLREQQERQAAAQAIGQDPNVKALCEAFSAQITAIRPGGP